MVVLGGAGVKEEAGEGGYLGIAGSKSALVRQSDTSASRGAPQHFLCGAILRRLPLPHVPLVSPKRKRREGLE